MKKFKLLSLLLIIALFSGVLSSPALAVEDPVTAAQFVVLLDTDTGEVLYQKNADAPFAPASLNMLMTALVAGDSLERQDVRLDDLVTVSDTVYYNIPEGYADVIGLTAGESLTIEQLLYASVLASAGDAANALAEYIYGSYDAFAAAMNAKAAELGCINTYFANANGVYSDGQVTTAMDLARIAQAAFQNEQVMSFFETSSYTIPATVSAPDRPLTSPNALINSADERHYELAYAGKNAYNELGSHLTAAATYNGMDVVAVLVGCPEGVDPFVEARNLFDWVFANFGYHTLVGSTDILDTIPVAMGSPDSVGVRASDTIQMLMPNDQDISDMSLDIVYAHEQEGTQLQAPINVGEYLGDLTVTVGGQVRGTSRVVAATAVDISRLNYLRSQLDVLLQNQSVRQIITILLGALGVYLLLVVVYVIQRIVHMHSLRRARKARARTRAQQELGWLEMPAEAPQIEDGGYMEDGGYTEPGPDEPVDFREEPAEEDEPEGAEQDIDREYAPAESDAQPDGMEQGPIGEEERADEDEEPAEEGGEVGADAGREDAGEEVEENAREDDGDFEDDGEYYEDEGEYADEEDEFFDGEEDEGGHHRRHGRSWWKRK